MQRKPRSSSGSPRWAYSQSTTARRPSSPTIRFPLRKSPWTSRGSPRRVGLALADTSARPSSSAGRGAGPSSSIRRTSASWSSAPLYGSPGSVEVSTEWIVASARPVSAARRARTSASSGLRAIARGRLSPVDSLHHVAVAQTRLPRRSGPSGRGTGTPAAMQRAMEGELDRSARAHRRPGRRGSSCAREVAPEDERVAVAGRVDGVEGPRLAAGSAGEPFEPAHRRPVPVAARRARRQRVGELPGGQHLRHGCMQSRGEGG